MSEASLPKLRCAVPTCGRVALTGKIYCYMHAKMIAQKFHRQWIAMKDRSAK